MNRAVFFDRDGVLNKLVSRDGGFFSPRTVDDFQLVPKAEDVINQIKFIASVIVRYCYIVKAITT